MREAQTLSNLPLGFEVNLGQTSPQVSFLSRGKRSRLFLSPNGSVVAASAHAEGQAPLFRMELAGGRATPKVTGLDELPGKVNCYIGDDRSQWRSGIPTYGQVQYQQVYPGVDIIYHGNQGQLEYDFVVAPSADPQQIRLVFPDAEHVTVDGGGELVVSIASTQTRQHRPVIYQDVNGLRTPITGGYVLRGKQEAGFEVGPYDQTKPLVIDPVLVYSTYLGGSSGTEEGRAIAVDSLGHAIVTGSTWSDDFPTAGAVQPAAGGNSEIFVSKFNSDGNALLFSTYIGNGGHDVGNGIAVDSHDNIYVTGQRSFDTEFADIFNFHYIWVGKFDPNGALTYSATFNGTGDDQGNGIAVDRDGFAYVVGTMSGGDPSPGTIVRGFQDTFNGALTGDVYVGVISPEGNSIVYSTFIGGSGADEGNGIALDNSGNIFVTGWTSGGMMTTPDAFQPAFRGAGGGGGGDAFVVKIDPSQTGANSLVYSTYLGGDLEDVGFGIAVDAEGSAYVTGSTRGGVVKFFETTVGSFQPLSVSICGDRSCGDVFVAKLSPAGSSLVYSTYLGGAGDDRGYAIAVDAAGSAYVAGQASHSFPIDFPVTVNASQASYGGGLWDGFVTKLTADGSGLVSSTFLGGEAPDVAQGIALDAKNNVYVTGWTGSTNFPTKDPFQGFRSGDGDIFVAKISGDAPTGPVPTISIGRGSAGITLTWTGLLESATDPAGPWSEVPGASSPLKLNLDTARRFYRSKSQ